MDIQRLIPSVDAAFSSAADTKNEPIENNLDISCSSDEKQEPTVDVVNESDTIPQESQQASAAESAQAVIPVPADNSVETSESKSSSSASLSSSSSASRLNVDPDDYVPVGTHELTDTRDQRLFRILRVNQTRFCEALYSLDELILDRFLKTGHRLAKDHEQIVSLGLGDGMTSISCINWRGRCFITGTDIVRILLWRFQRYCGRGPISIKKFEEGVFSDLRRLSAPQDCVLEATRSDFLVFLFDRDCVRSKKKQKVFFWKSFLRCADTFFADAVERELARMEMAHAIGMSVEEFIKAGIVPSVTGLHDSRHSTGSGDWTLMSERAILNGDDRTPTGAPKAFLPMEYIHTIKMDITSLFSRVLRTVLSVRKDKITEGVETFVDNVIQQRAHDGPPVLKPSPGNNNQASEGNYSTEDSTYESGPSPVARTRRAPARKQVPSSPLVRSSVVKSPGGARRRSRFDNPTPPPDSRSVLFQYDDDNDDNYSVSTLSSNEEEIQNIARSFSTKSYHDYLILSRASPFSETFYQESLPRDSTEHEPHCNCSKSRTNQAGELRSAADTIMSLCGTDHKESNVEIKRSADSEPTFEKRIKREASESFSVDLNNNNSTPNSSNFGVNEAAFILLGISRG